MRPLEQRKPRVRDNAHLKYVREQACCVCGSRRYVEAAHLRMACAAIGKPETGMQEKPSDRWVTPLCRYHHRTGIDAQHKMGERDFWTLRGINPFELATRLFIESGGYARSIEKKDAARVKMIKPRKPREQRRKVANCSRPIPYRRFDGTPVYAGRER